MQIQELFAKPIDRPINGVIKADQRDAESVWQELDEYVATKQVTEYLRKFFDAYLATAQHPNDPAIVSRMGALATASLCPRLCKLSPEESRLTTARSSSIRSLTTMAASSAKGAPRTSVIARSIRWAAAPA